MPTFSTTTPARLPHFTGARTTRLAQNALLSPHSLQLELRDDTDPYLGALPTALADQPELKQTLDDVAGLLKRSNFSRRMKLGKNMEVRKLGRGAFGAVYRLRIDSQDYAFKVFQPNPVLPAPGKVVDVAGKVLGHGPFAEPATGLYFTHQQTRDMARFYIANPSADWQLYEYIDVNSAQEDRPGKSIAEHGYLFQDDFKPSNTLHGIRVDYGGMLPYNPVSRAIRAGSRVLDRFFKTGD